MYKQFIHVKEKNQVCNKQPYCGRIEGTLSENLNFTLKLKISLNFTLIP